MKTHISRGLFVFVVLALAPLGIASAHGQPVIAVQPDVVAAGGQITVTGTEMEPGEEFAITLEGPGISIPLGKATAIGSGEEGGFVSTLTIPEKTASGSYTVRAATDKGEAAVADLTVTAPSREASAKPAEVREPTGEIHPLDRSKPAGQIIGAIVAAIVSGGLGCGWFVNEDKRGKREVGMFRQLGFHSDDMALAFVLWLCTLPLVALLVVPFFGLKIGGVVALVLFFGAMAICWGVCGWKAFKGGTR